MHEWKLFSPRVHYRILKMGITQTPPTNSEKILIASMPQYRNIFGLKSVV